MEGVSKWWRGRLARAQSAQAGRLVHGCFWHRHNCRLGRPMPATRRAFWRKKLEANRQRDRRQRRALRRLGWKTLVVWECQTPRKPHPHPRPRKSDPVKSRNFRGFRGFRGLERLAERIERFLEG